MTVNSANGARIDELNRRILAELQADARLSMSELARRVGASGPTVTERVRRLEQAGIIRGYHAVIDPAALGLAVSAWVRVRPAPRQLPKIAELAARTDAVTECHRTTGEECFLVRVHAASVADLEQTLDAFLLYGQTVTSVIVSTPVPPRGPAIPA